MTARNADPASLPARIGRLRYAAAQTARVGWYMSHYLLARRLSGPFDRPGEPPFRPKAKPGKRERVQAAFLQVFAKDRANIEAGLYPEPKDFGLHALPSLIEASRRFFEDLPRVDQRRMERRGVEVRQQVERGRFPTYYVQNFHYQTGGWLTEDSARLYDMQVEVLFGGAADAMRRATSLALLAQWMSGRDQRHVRVLDVACGNGRFLSQALDAFPRLKAVGLDLSPAYVGEARKRLADWPQAEVVQGQAEAAPFEDASFDALTCVYLFHELPPRVRRDVAREMARLVKPGGVLILADSLQSGDNEDLEQMLEYFPIGFHEPYYGSYVTEDLPALFSEAGFALEETQTAFLTKALRFRRL